MLLALEMVRTQSDFNHAHTKRQTPEDPMNCGLKMVTIITVDTDVVVLAVAHFQGLPNIQQLWIAFGTGKEFKYIPIHKIASAICRQFAKIMLFFHIHRLRRNIIFHQPWKEIRMEDRD